MKLSHKLAALFFVSACAISTNVNAHESALEQIVSNLVRNTLNNATTEIEVQIEKTLLSASNAISVDTDTVPANSVTITDLATADTKQKNEQQDNSTDKADG